MKKTFKIILTLILAITTLSCVFASAAGEPSVIFNGATDEIEFKDASIFGAGSEPDLFPLLKNIVPGDSVTQDIKVGAKNIGGKTVKLYLKAANANADFNTLVQDYGAWIHFTVKCGTEELTGDLTTGVLLGEFTANRTETVSITVSIDESAGNELQPLTAEVDWIFTAEVLSGGGGGGIGGGGTEPTPSPDPTPSPEPTVPPVEPSHPVGGEGGEEGGDTPGSSGGEYVDEPEPEVPGRPVLPLTGVERRPIWIFLGLGCVLIVVGVLQLCRRRENA